MACYVGHSVGENNNWSHCPISVDSNWATNYWIDQCHAYFLALTEVNANYLQGYLVDRADVDPQLDFRHQLGWEMVDKRLDEETESGGFDRRRKIARRGNLGDHELMTAPKYCGKWLDDENKWRRVKHTYQKQICNNRSGDWNVFTRRYYRCTKGLFLCAEFYATRVFDSDT